MYFVWLNGILIFFLFIANLQVVYCYFKMLWLFNIPLHYAIIANVWDSKIKCFLQKNGLFVKQSFQFCHLLFPVVFQIRAMDIDCL